MSYHPMAVINTLLFMWHNCYINPDNNKMNINVVIWRYFDDEIRGE